MKNITTRDRNIITNAMPMTRRITMGVRPVDAVLPWLLKDCGVKMVVQVARPLILAAASASVASSRSSAVSLYLFSHPLSLSLWRSLSLSLSVFVACRCLCLLLAVLSGMFSSRPCAAPGSS